MRWLGLMVALGGLAGCGAGDTFSLHPRVAATAAGQTLTVDHLAQWIAAVKRTRPGAAHFEAIAALYVDDMLFGVAAAERRDLDDSLLVLAARWPTVAQLRWTRLRDELARARGPLTPTQVDS